MRDAAPHPDLLLSSYDFSLPTELIAQRPTVERDASRLFVFDREQGNHGHGVFPDILEHVREGDLMVFNQTRVVPARTAGVRVGTGGAVSALFLGHGDSRTCKVILGNRGKLTVGERLSFFDDALQLVLSEKQERGLWSCEVIEGDINALLERSGRMPLPPYIRRGKTTDELDSEDRDRYQTIFAGPPGAVAAPTAGLHFTDDIMARLDALNVKRTFVTLHVGLGTFQPIECERFTDHTMHEEWYEVTEETAQAHRECRESGGRVIAVGTTSVRSLQAAWNPSTNAVVSQVGKTRLFLHPPQEIPAIDALLTNFHLPQSSLLLLVSCMTGREALLRGYEEAVREQYRFFSYGDAMLIM